ncbi:hypothetical protein [Arenimonas terrae]|uniref:Uncharacterized protein n=1 Tax=Arenimonas terrae TaxID=2546226 RepID=A0A5C4RPD0_9GAMM|nr:hypothetical protein [Arenimonas terrae]TNJ32972.1 hypothetical protein E1B00_11690 [Arenimonas terrae]
MRAIILGAIFLLLSCASSRAAAVDVVRYVYAKKAGAVDLVYRVDGKSFNESELSPYFRANTKRWPRDTLELRLVFDGDVPLAWFHHARRTFIFLGFEKIRCFSGSAESGKAIEIEEVGQSIALPEGGW